MFPHHLYFFSPTSCCRDTLHLKGNEVAIHSSYHYSHALQAAVAPAVLFVCLHSVLNFTIQKCNLAHTSKNPVLLFQQPIGLDGKEQFYHGCLGLIQRRILIEQNQSKTNSFGKFIALKGLILLPTWILLVVRGKLLRYLLHMIGHLPTVVFWGSKEPEVQWSVFIIVLIYQYCKYET